MPKPVLQAMVLADNVYQDRMTGKFIIAGTFSRLGITRRLGPPLVPAPPVAPPGNYPAPAPASSPASLLDNPPPTYASAMPIEQPPAPAAPPPPPPVPPAPVPPAPVQPAPAQAAPSAQQSMPQPPLPPPSQQPQTMPPGVPPQETTTFRNAAELTRAVSTAGSPHLYVALTDVHRTIPLKVRFVDLSDITETVPRFEIGLEVSSPDPVAVTELVIPMPRLPVTGPGTFSLDLLYAGEILGSWRIVVTEEVIPG